MNNLTKLEKDVLKMLLDGEDGVLLNLKAQLDLVSVENRKLSGVGFFTNLVVPQSCKASATNSSLEFRIGDVHADIEGLDFGAGFILYVEDGIIKMLEAYSYDEPWPLTIDFFKLTYVNGQRDLEKLRSSWS
ncbi:MAG: hypothetical protein MJK10_01330 [Pseudomonadales bacterium]|nr:hypothetical protein [Pseudomonadales bacterium]NRA14518.1 hypothetical protein [Oceanospirillaceae bacterium]